jgi:DNA-binding transcriptional ArsR family regulator
MNICALFGHNAIRKWGESMQELARVFKALGDENRLRIIAALDDREHCVCELARQLDIPQPTLSHHLKILRDTGLVIGEKNGPLIHCRICYASCKRYGIDLEAITLLIREREKSVV